MEMNLRYCPNFEESGICKWCINCSLLSAIIVPALGNVTLNIFDSYAYCTHLAKALRQLNWFPNTKQLIQYFVLSEVLA